ncbi:MAG: ParB N-terminal domain-containing protein [Pseudomonadota bacterium]
MTTLSRIAGPALPDGNRPDIAPWPFEATMIPISQLRVRKSYQRQMTKTSGRRALRIATGFDWSKFGILIVAAIEGEELFEVVDGQHRASAAQMVGVEDFPAIVIDGSAADAFLGINRERTPLHALSIHHAAVEAGEPDHVSLARLAVETGVTILRSVPSGGPTIGQTTAVKVLRKTMSAHGQPVLGAALIALRKVEEEGGFMPNAPTLISTTNVQAVAELVSLMKPDWAGTHATLGQQIGDALAGLNWERAGDDAKLKQMESGQPKWRCLFGILNHQVSTWRAENGG